VGSEAPVDWAELVTKLDLDASGLEEVAEAIAHGDSSAASAAMLEYFLNAELVEAPHVSFADPVMSAEEILRGELNLPLHPSFNLPADPDWSEDPFGDSNWRFQYHTFRWPMALLYAFQETNDRRFLYRFLFLITDYARDNFAGPPPSDMTWYDMAAAQRIENWLYAWKSLLELDEVNEEFAISFLSWSFHHGEMLSEYIEYESAGNHGTFHSRALVSLGLVLPMFNDSPHWLDLGTERLESQLFDIVSPVGVHLEQSVYYHFYMMLTYNDIRTIFQQGGIDFSAEAVQRLEGMPLFGAHIIKPNGYLPMLGDTAIRNGVHVPMNLHPWLDWTLSQGQAGSAAPELCVFYPYSGYVIFRSGWGHERAFEEETQLVFDTGPVGSGHGHYDAQTFTLSAYGEDLIVDGGYYTFTGEWRSYFKSPAAHNVVLPQENSPDVWLSVPESLVWEKQEDAAFKSSQVILDDGRLWRRSVVHLPPDDFILLDQVDEVGPSLESLFHFAPNMNLISSDQYCSVSGDSAQLDLFALGIDEMLKSSGELDPIQGWYSPRYQIKEPNQVLHLRRDDGRVDFQILLHPHKGDAVINFELLEHEGSSYLFHIERSWGSEEVRVDEASGQVIRSLVP